MTTQERVFRTEYERLNRDVYDGRLPAWPGVELTGRADIFSMTRTVGFGPWRRLQPFLLSRHVEGELLLEAARHEVAHTAALFRHEDDSHGPTWLKHARLCGAVGHVTLDAGHPLRATWIEP